VKYIGFSNIPRIPDPNLEISCLRCFALTHQTRQTVSLIRIATARQGTGSVLRQIRETAHRDATRSEESRDRKTA
jgi:hypothetical protein